MSRADSLVKLAWAYGLHLARRRLTRPKSQLGRLVETYDAAGRSGKTRLPDLATSYMRLYSRLVDASSDLDGDEADLEAATAACPVGLPLTEVAAVVRRLATG